MATVLLFVGVFFSACSNPAGPSNNTGGGGEQPPAVQTYAVAFGAEGEHGTLTAKIAGGAEIISGNKVRRNSLVVFSAKPEAGYVVNEWTVTPPSSLETGGTAGCDTAKIKITQAAEVHVSFKNAAEGKYAVAFRPALEAGESKITAKVLETGDDLASGNEVEKDKTVEFTAVPDIGWEVTDWSVVKTDGNIPLSFISGTGTNGSLTAKVRITEAVTVEAKFRRINYRLTFAVEGGNGTLTAKAENAAEDPVGEWIPYGTKIIFTASSDNGYAVDKWIIAGGTFEDGTGTDGNDTAAIKIIAETTVKVRFKKALPPPEAGKIRITIKGDGRIDDAASGYIDVAAGQTWKSLKPQVEQKMKLDTFFYPFDYGVYKWKLNDESGKELSDTDVFTTHTTVYAVTNYTGFEIEGTVLKKVTGHPRGKIIVPDGITEIASEAFARQIWVTRVEFPESLKIIGNHAFLYCTSLYKLELPENLETIGMAAFADCSKLEGTVVLPKNLKAVPRSAFSNCSKMEGVDFSACTQLVKIAEYAFNECSSLTAVELPACLTDIERDAFSGCKTLSSLTVSADNAVLCDRDNIVYTKDKTKLLYVGPIVPSVNFPEELGEIPSKAFKDHKELTQVSFPKNLKTIGDAAFANCTALERPELPENLKTIGRNVFFNCQNMQGTIALPKNLKVIEGYAFAGCNKINGFDFSACIDLAKIEENAFYGCSSLTAMKLPASLAEIGEDAFKGCTNLGTLTINAGNASFYAQDNVVYDKAKTKILFVGPNISIVNIPEGVTEISRSRFYERKDLTQITFPRTLKKISETVFQNCTALSRVQFEEELETIGEDAFMGCTALTGITELPKKLKRIGEGAFENCTALTGTVVLPEVLETIYMRAFGNCSGINAFDFSGCRRLREIGPGAFYNCTSLTAVELPESLSSISKSTFGGCSKLNSLTVNNSNQDLCAVDNVVYNKKKTQILCAGPNITSVTIPAGVTEIAAGVFSECKLLTQITFSAKLKTIEDRAFSKCTGLVQLRFPSDLTEIGSNVFEGCTSLTNADFSACASLAKIGNGIFEGCTGLISVNFSACTNLPAITYGAFRGCTRLTDVNLSGCAKLSEIGSEAFADCTDLMNMDFSACTNLSTISYRVFYGCTQAEVKLPESITKIEWGAFGGNTGSYCKKVKIKGGSEYNRIYALVTGATCNYLADRVEQY